MLLGVVEMNTRAVEAYCLVVCAVTTAATATATTTDPRMSSQRRRAMRR